MNGTLGSVESFKKTMLINASQRITKGISSLNVDNYLSWLRSTYESSGQDMAFVWKRVQKVDSKSKRTFNGASVFKIFIWCGWSVCLVWEIEMEQRHSSEVAETVEKSIKRKIQIHTLWLNC